MKGFLQIKPNHKTLTTAIIDLRYQEKIMPVNDVCCDQSIFPNPNFCNPLNLDCC